VDTLPEDKVLTPEPQRIYQSTNHFLILGAVFIALAAGAIGFKLGEASRQPAIVGNTTTKFTRPISETTTEPTNTPKPVQQLAEADLHLLKKTDNDTTLYLERNWVNKYYGNKIFDVVMLFPKGTNITIYKEDIKTVPWNEPFAKIQIKTSEYYLAWTTGSGYSGCNGCVSSFSKLTGFNNGSFDSYRLDSKIMFLTAYMETIGGYYPGNSYPMFEVFKGPTNDQVKLGANRYEGRFSETETVFWKQIFEKKTGLLVSQENTQ
jgi:hypothetical protein